MTSNRTRNIGGKQYDTSKTKLGGGGTHHVASTNAGKRNLTKATLKVPGRPTEVVKSSMKKGITPGGRNYASRSTQTTFGGVKKSPIKSTSVTGGGMTHVKTSGLRGMSAKSASTASAGGMGSAHAVKKGPTTSINPVKSFTGARRSSSPANKFMGAKK